MKEKANVSPVPWSWETGNGAAERGCLGGSLFRAHGNLLFVSAPAPVAPVRASLAAGPVTLVPVTVSDAPSSDWATTLEPHVCTVRFSAGFTVSVCVSLCSSVKWGSPQGLSGLWGATPMRGRRSDVAVPASRRPPTHPRGRLRWAHLTGRSLYSVTKRTGGRCGFAAPAAPQQHPRECPRRPPRRTGLGRPPRQDAWGAGALPSSSPPRQAFSPVFLGRLSCNLSTQEK